MTTPTQEQIEAAPCPFCGAKAKFGLSKLTGCQLHGDPIQCVQIFCDNKECPVKPIIHGHHNIYGQGEDKLEVKAQTQVAKQILAARWNDRHDRTAISSLQEEITRLKAEVERNKWQPIETVPKDGTYVELLFDGPFPDRECLGVAIGKYCKEWHPQRPWYLTALWASTMAFKNPIAWRMLPSNEALAPEQPEQEPQKEIGG